MTVVKKRKIRNKLSEGVKITTFKQDFAKILINSDIFLGANNLRRFDQLKQLNVN